MTAPPLRALVGGVCASALALTPTLAAAQLGGGGYTVSGKKGPFIKQVANRDFSGSAGGGSLGLADDAINRGEFQAARLRMPQTEARVNQLLASIDSKWPYAKRPIKVQILGLNQYSAQSLPDGSVIIAFGLLETAQSDDEVAFVLAHELGHVRLNHFAAGVKAQNRQQSMSKLGQVFVVGATMTGGVNSIRNGGGLGSLDAAAYAAGRRASAAEDLLHFINDVMVTPSWSRGQEDEADAIGFDLSLADSYAAESASAKVFDTIQADADNRAAETEALNAKMKEELGKAAGETAVQAAYSGGISGSGLRSSLLKVGGKMAMTAAANQSGGPKHRSPEQRKKGMADYTASAYPQGVPLADERTAWLTAVRSSPEYAQAKVAVMAVNKAMRARAEGNYAAAQGELNRAMTTSYRSSPLVLNEAARLQDDMGQIDASDRLFRSAHQSPDQSIDGYLDHASLLLRAARYDQADQIIAQGTQRFGNDDKPFISLQIAIADKQGRADRRDQLMARCGGYSDPALVKDCKLAAKQEMKQEKAEAKKGSLPGMGGLLGGLPFKKN
jgi:beta-barrel assembly-enhancing protease